MDEAVRVRPADLALAYGVHRLRVAREAVVTAAYLVIVAGVFMLGLSLGMTWERRR